MSVDSRACSDWVLAESQQTAPHCTCEEVLAAYLDGGLQRRWSADKVIDVQTSAARTSRAEPCYVQDLVLHSQRVLARHTGVMRYSQRIVVDRVGAHAYCVLVELVPERGVDGGRAERGRALRGASAGKRPFRSLAVYVHLAQRGADVDIYAAGVFEVDRRVVPHLVLFDASGIAADMAGKGTLWLSAHFGERERVQRERAQTQRAHTERAQTERAQTERARSGTPNAVRDVVRHAVHSAARLGLRLGAWPLDVPPSEQRQCDSASSGHASRHAVPMQSFRECYGALMRGLMQAFHKGRTTACSGDAACRSTVR